MSGNLQTFTEMENQAGTKKSVQFETVRRGHSNPIFEGYEFVDKHKTDNTNNWIG